MKEEIEVAGNGETICSKLECELKKVFKNFSVFLAPSDKNILPLAHDECFLEAGLQCAYLGMHADAWLTSRLQRMAGNRHSISIMSGYLNLSPEIEKGMQGAHSLRIQCASSSANGFYNSDGLSRLIPSMYTVLEADLLERLVNKHLNVSLWQYDRPNWTFHAKGLWVYDELGKLVGSIFGSSNFGYRSRDRDLELTLLCTAARDLFTMEDFKLREHSYNNKVAYSKKQLLTMRDAVPACVSIFVKKWAKWFL